ncbi:MAG: zinc dependent phospholipase C family protein [Candidatus Latescibacteria bacterium]|nr:zinc dependent phospholipase C family protein [Candidatus Latescibacterota bacterium]
MPRGRCHFALLLALQDRLEAELPEVGALTAAYLPEFLAGSLAPDAMRAIGKMGKYGSHFYSEDRRDSWGKSVSGMFESHPGLADCARLDARAQVLLMGYISHLTADEAFRDEVTIHVHGTEEWRPIIHGLWSFVDELKIDHSNLASILDQFEGQGQVGFIDRQIALVFLKRARGWAISEDPVAHERVFLEMIGHSLSDAEVKKRVDENRGRAELFLSEQTKRNFIDEAIVRAFDEVRKFASGGYVQDAQL